MQFGLTRRSLLGTAAMTLFLPEGALAQARRPASPAAPAGLRPLAFPAAFDRAANAVLSGAPSRGTQPAELVIDPLVDGGSGAQTLATRGLGVQLEQLIAARYADRFVVRPFTSETLARKPLVFIGTLTPVATVAGVNAAKDAYRVWFSMLDLASQSVVSKAQAHALPDGVDSRPVPAFAEAPAWTQDPAIAGYINSCQATKIGDPIKPEYLQRIDAAALVSEAIDAFDANKLETALERYTQARTAAGGDQLRVLNGLYLTNRKLERTDAAQSAFRDLVDFGLASGKLSLMMLFQPGTTRFVSGNTSSEYQFWLATVAERAKAGSKCLRLIGHASRTGTERFNDQLSLSRADTIKSLLAAQASDMGARITTRGAGWRENIIGTGRDDDTDALDRRVEFKVDAC